MKNNKINHLYIFLASLFFILALNATFYYFYQQKMPVEPIFDKNVQFTDFDNTVVKPLVIESSDLILPGINDSDYILGNKEADIEMIIYDDPTGAFSPEYFSRVQTLQEEFRDEIKIALRLLPLNMHKYSIKSCLAMICAGEQDKYFEAYIDLLQANKDNNIREYLDNITERIGIDDEKFRACLVGGGAQEKLDNWIKEADDYYIIGAPNTFINNRPYLGAYQLDDFIDSAGFERIGLRSVIRKLKIY